MLSGPGAPDNPPQQPRRGASPADSFPTRAGPSGETEAGRGEEEMGAPLRRTVRGGEGTKRGCGRTAG